MTKTQRLSYLEWLALNNLYQHRDNVSSPARYVGLDATIQALIKHQPPLAQWVGKPSNHQIHITPEGVAVIEANNSDELEAE
jgi:hypothetical protein